jgi:hypothetical protein
VAFPRPKVNALIRQRFEKRTGELWPSAFAFGHVVFAPGFGGGVY